MNNGEWSEGIVRCDYDAKLETQQQYLGYNVREGIFNDLTQKKSLQLAEEERGIVNEYLGGRLPLFHFDMYRLASSDDLFDIGWEDYLDRGGVCAVEWSENVADAMENAIVITMMKLLSSLLKTRQ